MEGEYVQTTLESIAESVLASSIKTPPNVIAVVNNPKVISESRKEENRETLSILYSKKNTLPYPLHIFDYTDPGLDFGVGQARKIGMDYASHHFAKAAHDKIICLDADCTVSKNYISRLQNLHGFGSGFTVEFEHALDQKGMVLYELYLRYMQKKLAQSGSPFSHFPIGSSLGVSAQAYRESGGMVKKTATEDFHFLNKIRKHGDITHLSDTFVYPSNRKSQRVSLGTGYFLYHYSRDSKQSFSSLMIPSPADFLSLQQLHQIIYDQSQDNESCKRNLSQLRLSSINLHLERRKFWDKRRLALQQNLQHSTFHKRIMEAFDALESLRLLRVLSEQHEKPSPPLFLSWIQSIDDQLLGIHHAQELLIQLRRTSLRT